MKRKDENDMSAEHNLLTRLIDKLISTFLFVILFVLFIVIFRRIFGTSDIVWILGPVICFPLASIVYILIDKSFSALLVLLLFAFPALALILVFLVT